MSTNTTFREQQHRSPATTDRSSLMVWSAVLLVVKALDAMTTKIGLWMGHHEANPTVAYAMDIPGVDLALLVAPIVSVAAIVVFVEGIDRGASLLDQVDTTPTGYVLAGSALVIALAVADLLLLPLLAHLGAYAWLYLAGVTAAAILGPVLIHRSVCTVRSYCYAVAIALTATAVAWNTALIGGRV